MAKNVIKNPRRDLDITANFATAAVSRNPKKPIKTLPELITCYNKCEGLYLDNFVIFMLIKKDQKYDRIYPSAPLEKDALEQSLEKEISNV